ncbi:ATP synthase-coupling factor 6, mitochondrial [Bulinus truncatus]|nr:ATP synthase-coupling factor 6, mitochondrial [Bulinus truncatus]
MLRQVFQKVLPVATLALQRNFAATAVASQNLDPIQQLFLDKIRDYRAKSKGGKLVDATPESEASLNEMLGNLERAYGAKGIDMTQFPTFNFSEPTLVWPGLSPEQQEKIRQQEEAEKEAESKRLAQSSAEEPSPNILEGFEEA